MGLAGSEISAEKLQSRFLTAMVREGALELHYPDVRNRPDQAYRTVSKLLQKKQLFAHISRGLQHYLNPKTRCAHCGIDCTNSLVQVPLHMATAVCVPGVRSCESYKTAASTRRTACVKLAKVRG